jgi:hypothetical protein
VPSVSTSASLMRVGLGRSVINFHTEPAWSQRSSTRSYSTGESKTTTAATIAAADSTEAHLPPTSILASYKAPLAKTFIRLKMFSLGSLTLVSALCPVLMLAPSSIGLAGRIGLCITALATSGASTALIAWIGKPYVSEMQLLSGQYTREQLVRDLPEGDAELHALAKTRSDKPAIQVLTTNWRLEKLQTTIYEPGLIRPTSRPFATWELPITPPSLAMSPGKHSQEAQQQQTLTKLVAVTRSAKSGKVVGRWWARWSRDTLTKGEDGWKSDGQCREEGKVLRHFSIHEDLLNEDWQVL